MRKPIKNGRKKRILGLVLAMTFLLIGTTIHVITYQSIEQKKADRSVVDLQKENNKKIVFYKDDCPDCDKVFNQLFWHDRFNKDTVFVNLNQKQNRHYIQTYQVKSVPTIIHSHSRYEGIDRKEIQKIMQE